jgi:uncharacterized LabA/DUF88 family protein
MDAYFEGQRIAILVDTANVYHSAKIRYQGRVDYKKLMDLIVRERKLVRAIAFVERSEDVEITPFLDALRAVGFETRIKTLRRTPDLKTKGGDWDVGIALHAAQLAHKVDCIALVSGDGAFIDLVDYLSHNGLRTEIYAFDGCVSSELTYHADYWCPIDEDWLMDK